MGSGDQNNNSVISRWKLITGRATHSRCRLNKKASLLFGAMLCVFQIAAKAIKLH